MLGKSVFALASLAASLATSTASLLAARAVQGFGAALAVPAALALLTAAFRQGRERERAVGLLSAVLDVVAFLIAAGILVLGAVCAVRTLPARALAGG